VTAFFLRI